MRTQYQVPHPIVLSVNLAIRWKARRSKALWFAIGMDLGVILLGSIRWVFATGQLDNALWTVSCALLLALIWYFICVMREATWTRRGRNLGVIFF